MKLLFLFAVFLEILTIVFLIANHKKQERQWTVCASVTSAIAVICSIGELLII